MVRRTTTSIKILETLTGLLVIAAPTLAGPPEGDGLPPRPTAAPEVDAVEPLDPAERPMRRSVCLELPRLSTLCEEEPGCMVRQVTLRELPPGSLHVEYEGFQSFLARRLQSRYRSLWRDQIDLWYDETNMTDAEFRAAREEIQLGFQDLKTGRWWERSWRDSLLPEKGGAPETPWVHKVGQEIDVVRIGAFRFTNELKIRIDGWTVLALEPDPGLIFREREEIAEPTRVARDHARLGRALRDPQYDGRRPTTRDGAVGALPVLAPMVGIELVPARRIIWEGVTFRVKLRPQISARVPSDMRPAGFVRSLSLRCSIDMFLGKQNRQVMGIDLACTWDPEDREVEAMGNLALINW